MTPSIKETVERLRVVAHNENLNNGMLRGTTPAMLEAAALIERLAGALEALVNLERIQTPDMSGKPRDFAYMECGGLLAAALDDARRVLSGEPTP